MPSTGPRLGAGALTADEPRLDRRDLDAAIRAFCGSPVEFWAWCPTVEALADVFGRGEHAPEAFERFWDWDFQLLRLRLT
jgi:hypothetical protein